MKKKYCYWLSTFENMKSDKSLLKYPVQAKIISKKVDRNINLFLY